MSADDFTLLHFPERRNPRVANLPRSCYQPRRKLTTRWTSATPSPCVLDQDAYDTIALYLHEEHGISAVSTLRRAIRAAREAQLTSRKRSA